MKYVSKSSSFVAERMLTNCSGLWVIFPAYMTVVFGSDIIAALDIAAGAESGKKEN